MRKSLALVLTLGSAVTVFAACSSKPNPPPVTPTTTPDAGAEAMAPDAGVPLATPDASAPPFFTGGTDAGAPTTPTTPTTPVSPALGDAALDAAIDIALGVAQPKLAPKMEKEGAAGRATLAQGGHFSMMVNLSPGRCYTFIATSVPGTVAQMDMKLFGPPFFNIEAGKSAAGEKNLPVIGKGTAALCPMIPLAVPYKLDVAATKGAGRIGVQMYARNK